MAVSASNRGGGDCHALRLAMTVVIGGWSLHGISQIISKNHPGSFRGGLFRYCCSPSVLGVTRSSMRFRAFSMLV